MILKYQPLSKQSLCYYSPVEIKQMLVADWLSIADDEMEIMESYVKEYEEKEKCKHSQGESCQELQPHDSSETVNGVKGQVQTIE